MTRGILKGVPQEIFERNSKELLKAETNEKKKLQELTEGLPKKFEFAKQLP